MLKQQGGEQQFFRPGKKTEFTSEIYESFPPTISQYIYLLGSFCARYRFSEDHPADRTWVIVTMTSPC